jgi:predicted cupin superfamily sugar epimerase
MDNTSSIWSKAVSGKLSKLRRGGEYSFFGVSVYPEFKPTEYVIKNRKELLDLLGDTKEKINFITKYSDTDDFSKIGLGNTM